MNITRRRALDICDEKPLLLVNEEGNWRFMKFEHITSMSRKDEAEALRSGDLERVRRALISASLHDPDRMHVESLIEQFMQHEDHSVQNAAAIAASHLARIHGSLAEERIVPMLKRLLADPRTEGAAHDALSDFEIYLARKA